MFAKNRISVSPIGDLSFYEVHDDPDLTNVQWKLSYTELILCFSLSKYFIRNELF